MKPFSPLTLRTRIAFFLLALATAGAVLAAGGVQPDGTTRTSTDRAQNGVPVVEIAPPNAHGVSRNSYTDFNVNPKGLILNNADSVGVSQLGGALPPNPHFHVGEGASIILNEVRSTRPSSLNGFSEIFGRRAEFILANPNGITCDGCGFINTSRATLITGSENDPAGAVGRFTLGPGNIAIQGAGLYGDNLPYVDLISRAVQVQARLQAGAHLAVRTGNDQYDHASDAVSSTPAPASASVYAIDADRLGSMYAGQIALITTQAGVGVRTAAPVIAQDSVYMNSAGGLDTAQVQAGNTLILRAQGVLHQQGAYQAAKRIDLEAATLSLGQPISVDQDLRLVQTRGDWAVPTLQGGTGRTEITASTGSLQFNAPVFAAGDLVLSGKGIINTSQLAARGTVALNTTGNITNAAGALVFAGGDLSVQADGSLDNRGELQARGALMLAGLSGARMAAFTNRGGRVESGGDMYIAAEQVLNTHNFASSASPSTFGQTNRPAVRQSTGYDRRTHQTNWVETTNPGLQRGLIQSDGNLAITATNFTNDLSDVFAVGNLAITVAKLDNRAYALRKAYTASGRRWGKTGSHCRVSLFGHCVSGHGYDYGWITYYYQAIGNTGGSLPATIQAGGALSVNATQQINNATLAANAPVVSGVGATTDPLAGLILPGEGGLFRPNPAPDAAHPYLIETDPRLIDVKHLLGSTYFLQRIGYRPGKDVTLFLGDAAYDQRLIANQVRTTAGGRFLFATAQTDNAQYQRLVDQAAAERGRLGLALGKALTREQIAGLTSDILWYVQTEVAGQKVLAPRLYLSPQTRQRLAQARAARLSGTQVALTARDLLNQGTISAMNDLAIETRGDLINRGGRISAGTDLALSAGGALRSESVAWRVNAGADIRSAVIRMAGLSAGRDLHLAAGGDLTLTAGTLTAGRDASLDAGAQLALNTIALTNRRNTRQGDWNITDTRIHHATTQLAVGRNLALNAGRSLRIEGAQVQAGGDVQLQAGGDVQLLAVQDSHHRVATKTEYSGLFDSTKKTTTITTETTQQQGASVQSGGALSVRSGGDIVLLASHTGSGGDTRLDTRGGNIALLAGKNTDYYRYQHTSDGFIYTKQQDRGHYTERLAASTLQSGGALHLGTGAGIGVAQNAQRGDIVVAGATLSSGGAMDFGASPGTGDTGLAGVLPASGADGHVLSPSDAERVGNLRIASVGLENHAWNYSTKKLNGFAAALVGVGALIDPIGGALIAGLGLDLQKVDRVDDQMIHQQGANVVASGALAAYTRGDITISGSRVRAGGQATLDAGGNVRVLGAVDRHTHQETHSIARIKGASINWDGSRLSAGIDGEYRKTAQSQTQLTQQGAQLDAGSNLNIRSAGEVTVAASRLQAGRDLSVHADKGLSILSADDVQKQAEQQTRAKLRLSAGVGNSYNDFARSITAYKRAKAQRRAAQQALAGFNTELQKMQAEVNAGKATADDLRLRREDRKYYVANLALAKVNEATAAVQIVQAGERVYKSAAFYGFYADVMLEMHGNRRSSASQQTTSVASSLIAGRDLGLSAGADLHIQGSDLGAGRTLTLTAANDVTIEAARNTGRSRAERHSVSYQYSVGTYGMGADSHGWNVGLSTGFDHSQRTTWRNARLSANGQLAIHTGRDTAIAGANLNAANLIIDTGRNLEITSRQNTRYARGQDAGFSVGTGQVGVNGAHRSEDRRWTDSPTTLIARQRVAITTGDTTTITGALVAQIDANGKDGGQLSLRTRRLTVRTLTDTGNTKQWNVGLSTDLGTNKNAATGGGVPNSAKTRVQLGFGGHVGGQLTRATLGQGSVLISEGGNSAGLNRTIARFQTITANRNTGGLNADVTIDHRMLSVEGWKDIGNNIKHIGQFAGDIVAAAQQVIADPRLGALNYAQVLRADTILGQAVNALARTAQGRRVLGELNAHAPARQQQGLIGLGHYIQATYGLKLSDIAFYNAQRTTSTGLTDNSQRIVFGATVVDPNSPEYHSVFLAVNGTTKRNLGVTLGHETSHLDYGPGRGYLLFADSIPTQEGLADAAGKRLAQLLGERSPGIWDTADTAAWRQGLIDSPYTRLGTRRANEVGGARVEYRQLSAREIERIKVLAKRLSKSSGGAITPAQASARLLAAGCALVDCGAGFPNGNPARIYYQKLVRYAAHFTKEKALLAKQKYTSKGGESGNWTGGASPEGTQSSLFTYTLGDKVVDGWSHYQVGTRALGGVNLVGGVLGVGVGLGFGGVSVETGVGPIAATMLLTYSTDHAYAGARTLWSGRLTPTLLQSALIEAGLSPNTVAYVDGALGLLTGVGTLSPATLRLPLREIGVIRDAEEVGQTGRALVHGKGGMVRGATGDVAGRLKEAYRPNWQGEGIVTNKVDDIAAQAAKGKYANRTDVNYRSADNVNAEFGGYKLPYETGTRVTEYNTIEADQFVRVHGENNAARSWMMRREAIDGLSPQEIAKKYSLPEVPTKISDVNVPAGARVRTGKVAENFSGNEGAIQYQWLGRVPESAITNTRYLQGK